MGRGAEQLRLTPDERADLVAYIDNELPEGAVRAISTKLTHSATGRLEVDMLKKTWELLGHLPLPEAPADFTERTCIEIQRRELKAPLWGPRAQYWTRQAAFGLLHLGFALIGLALGYAGARWLWPDPSARLARDLSLAEHLDEYLEAGSFDFLKQLTGSHEFGGPVP